ncbi:MAG: hypothetical protein PHS07_00430 [Patescibacteria group bacterium]|nr:hypothetical protein [Patescibacteria group bacterium]
MVHEQGILNWVEDMLRGLLDGQFLEGLNMTFGPQDKELIAQRIMDEWNIDFSPGDIVNNVTVRLLVDIIEKKIERKKIAGN